MKYNIGDKVICRINYMNDSRKEVEAIICGITKDGDIIKYQINFEPDEYSKNQGATG